MPRLVLWVLVVFGFAACTTPAPSAPTMPPQPTPTVVARVAGTAYSIAAATTVAGSPVQIANANVDRVNVANSNVTLHNNGAQPVDLSGWTLLVGSYRLEFPTSDYMTLAPSGDKIVHLSSSPTPTNGDNVYLGIGAVSAGTAGITSGGTIVLLTSSGQVASTYQVP